MRMDRHTNSSSRFWQRFQKRLKSRNELTVQNIRPGGTRHRPLNWVIDRSFLGVSSELNWN